MEIRLKLSNLLQFLIDELSFDQLLVQNRPGTDLLIAGFSSIYDTKPNTLSWMTTQLLDWKTINASVIICSKEADTPKDTNIVFIPVENPRNIFALVLRKFYLKDLPSGISATAIIGDNCKLGNNVYIGNYTSVGNNVTIGDNTQIHSNVTIYDNIIVGSNCVIHSGVVIGADGFGYEQDTEGHSFKIPHIGRVVIEDYVEIGSNTCVARGVLADTVIKKFVKIGNLTHISHNVSIGENTMITHLAHIGGSIKIDENCWIAPGATYKQGLSIGKNSLTGLGAVVIRDVQPFDVVAGVPAKPIKKISETNKEG